MNDTPIHVLFLCTHNSARSILAEAALNHLGQGRFRAFSAGSSPRENQQPNPHALAVLEEAGLRTEGLRSKSWNEFAGAGAPAMDLIVTGRLMSGSEAVAAGLFSQAFPADEVTDAARAAARAAASGPTQAFVASKRLVAELRDERLGLWASMAHENRAQAALCDTDDYREGFAAFQQKRTPEFTGRS